MEVERRHHWRRESDRILTEAIKHVEAARRDQRRALRRAAIGYLILLVGCFLGALALENRTDNRLRDSQIAACRSVNQLRERVNSLSVLTWGVWDADAKRERTLAAAKTERAVHQAAAARLAAAREALRVQRVLSCPRAVIHPRSYVPPPLERIRP